MSPKLSGWAGVAGWLAVLAAPAAAAAAPAHEFSGAAAIVSADALIGRPVQTQDGNVFGRVRDIAVDMASGRIGYVVIAAGGTANEPNLVAVDPRALRPAGDAEGHLMLEADAASLRDTRRFGATDWPLRADIVARPTPPTDPAANGAEPPAGGTATISDGTRTATLSPGEPGAQATEPTVTPEPAAEPESWIRWGDSAEPPVE